MSLTLPDLPYSHDSLDKLGMSKETLEFHHDLHHKAYVDNGNKLIAGTEWENKSVEDIISGKYKTNTDIGFPAKCLFEKEVEKYCYMWREGGQFSKKSISQKK